MRKLLKAFIAFSLIMAVSGWAYASDDGWITTVMKAYPEDQVYKLNIQRIDGKQPMDARQYRVDPGQHTVRVSLVLDYKWAPKLARITSREIYSKEITFNVEAGKKYFLGGKVDPDASDEAQKDGSFWDPVIHETQSD